MRRSSPRPGPRAGSGALRAAALLASALVAGSEVVAQTSDTVLVTLEGERAQVVQRLAPDGVAIRAFALRLEEQTLDIEQVTREGEDLLDAILTESGRAYRLDVVSGAPITVTYTVGGRVERIPLFVTGGRAELTVVAGVEAPYLIRLEGPATELAALDLPTSLPRFERTEGGRVEVALSSLPALVRLSRGGPLSFARLADLVALAAILAAAAWTWRRGRAPGQPPAGGAEQAPAGPP